MTPLPALLLAATVAGQVQAGCQRGGVEWIVGGTVPFACDEAAPATPAHAVPAGRVPGAPRRVSTDLQRIRDKERRGILSAELAQEQRQLPRASDAAAARRTLENIAALKREIARLDDAWH